MGTFTEGSILVECHSNEVAEKVAEKIKNSPPKLIILLPNSPSFREIAPFLRDNYILIETIDGAEIWSLISPEAKAALLI